MKALALLLAEAQAPEVRLTTQGALIMAICIGLVLALGGFCMYRILREKRPAEHHHVPLEINTRDTNDSWPGAS